MLENFQKNVNSSIGMVTLRKGMSAFFLLCPFGAFGVMMAFMCPFSPEVGGYQAATSLLSQSMEATSRRPSMYMRMAARDWKRVRALMDGPSKS